MVLSGNTIKRLGIISPFTERTLHAPTGTTYGKSMAGYDITLDQKAYLVDGRMTLASAREYFRMPKNVVGIVHDKSTWARRGVFVQNTVIEPGWEGYLTLELTYAPILEQPEIHSLLDSKKYGVNAFSSLRLLSLEEASPIAQVVFHYTDEETEGYDGKYQRQERGPQSAR